MDGNALFLVVTGLATLFNLYLIVRTLGFMSYVERATVDLARESEKTRAVLEEISARIDRAAKGNSTQMEAVKKLLERREP